MVPYGVGECTFVSKFHFSGGNSGGTSGGTYAVYCFPSGSACTIWLVIGDGVLSSFQGAGVGARARVSTRPPLHPGKGNCYGLDDRLGKLFAAFHA